MSFGQNVAATKIELLKYKKSSQVAKMVQKILDAKISQTGNKLKIEGIGFQSKFTHC